MPRVGEEDHTLLVLLLGGEHFADDRTDRVGRLGGWDRPLRASELQACLAHLGLRICERLHASQSHERADDDGRIAVVAQAAGVDGRRDEVVSERVHG